MAETPPSNPIFDNAPGRSTGVKKDPANWYGMARTPEEAERFRSIQERIAKKSTDNPVVFQPNLLVRASVGDFGERPYTGVFWESPDIWIAVGDPDTTPAVPPNPGGIAFAGQANTLYAHVWNLGLAPLIGATVEFLVFDPTISFAGQRPLFRAITRVDLGGRTTPQECHKLVKCPVAWVPTSVNGGHECVIARVSGVGDPLQPTHQFEPRFDRHVGQRNIHVALYGANQQRLLDQLTKTLPAKSKIALWLGGAEARNTLQLVAPRLRLVANAKTRPLDSVASAPKPGPGEATVVRIQGMDSSGVPIGGYTLVLIAQPLG